MIVRPIVRQIIPKPSELRFLQNRALPTRVEFLASLLMLQHKQLFGPGQKMGDPAPPEFLNPRSLKNFLNRRHVRQQMLDK
jgi:hypothetical protein